MGLSSTAEGGQLHNRAQQRSKVDTNNGSRRLKVCLRFGGLFVSLVVLFPLEILTIIDS